MRVLPAVCGKTPVGGVSPVLKYHREKYIMRVVFCPMRSLRA